MLSVLVRAVYRSEDRSAAIHDAASSVRMVPWPGSGLLLKFVFDFLLHLFELIHRFHAGRREEEEVRLGQCVKGG